MKKMMESFFNNAMIFAKPMIIALAIIIASILMPYVGVKTLTEGMGTKPLEYTQMDEPDSETPIGLIMTALRNLDDPNTIATAEKLMPTNEVVKKYCEKMFLVYTKMEDTYSAKKYNIGPGNSLSTVKFNYTATSDLILRRFIAFGYSERIDWKNINFVGYTAVSPTTPEEQNIRLYFEDQGRIFYTGAQSIYIKDGEKYLSGVYFDDKTDIRSAENTGEGFKNLLRDLFK